MDYRAYPIVLFVWSRKVEDGIDFCRNVSHYLVHPLCVKKEKALQEGFFIDVYRRLDAGDREPAVVIDNGLCPRYRAVAHYLRRGRNPRRRLDGDSLGVLNNRSQFVEDLRHSAFVAREHRNHHRVEHIRILIKILADLARLRDIGNIQRES